MSLENRRSNRLINEKSPYLLQHAYNPVNWYPWGEEAFEASKLEDKPIFLSIGYSTCHWCHVMEKESFDDIEIANLLNETFINIKIDREELPEIDSLYMEFAQSMMSGTSGWPLNMVLTPNLEPFFAATYMPKESRHGLIGMKEFILKIRKMWNEEDREDVIEQAQGIVEMFQKNVQMKGSIFPDKELIDDTADLLFKMADPVYGGIKGAPKFPIAYQLNFLLRYSLTSKDSRSLFLVERTLDMMHRGGIYDHLGGGFCRYSIDEEWLIPHFEKMLYDNALLSYAYMECWKVTKKPIYKLISKEILDYLLREMQSDEGGFYSAEDADSEGEEGKFYTWELEEIENILGKDQSKLIQEYFGITASGNFHGKNVLHTLRNLDEFARLKGLDYESLSKIISEQKSLLFKLRDHRVHPFKDDKILVTSNAMTIFSLVEASLVFQDKRYLEAALKAAHFLKDTFWQNGELLRRYRDGDVRYKAGLEEYAYTIRAFLSLFEADLGSSWLVLAVEMCRVLEENFKEPEGAFYQTDGSNPHLLIRKCRYSDGAEPSGNAIHEENLIRLYQLTSDLSYIEQTEDIFSAAKKFLDNYPPGYIYHVMNLNHFYDKQAATIVVALNEENSHQEIIKNEIYSHFNPHKVVIFRHENDKDLFRIIPFVKDLVPINHETTLYVCYEGICQKPVFQIEEILEVIKNI